MKLEFKQKKIFWTEHSKIKMRQYGLSQQKILGILRRPERTEKAIVPELVAVMRTNPVKKMQGTLSKAKEDSLKEKYANLKKIWQRKAPGEIWVMYKDVKKQSEGNIRKIISAWRYPGISKPGEEIPIPEDIRHELKINGEL